VRVALIGPVPPHLGGATPGGVATHQVYLAAGLARGGIDAPLLATNTRVPPADWRAKPSEAQFPLFRMARPGRSRGQYLWMTGAHHLARYAAHLAAHAPEGSRRESLANLMMYRRFVEEVQPDLVHVQHPLERCTYIRTVKQLEGWSMPLVVTAHSLHGEHDESTIAATMAPNLRAADRVIAVSQHIAEQAVGLGVDQGKVRVIRSGVDTQKFRPGDREVARRALGFSDARVVLFVGNLEPRKQVDVLLRAMTDVRAELPGAQLVVVGSGESAGVQDQTARLMRLTRELALDEAVHFIGRVPDEQLLVYYAAADVLALPSSSEAQGIVALEAMACGLPVVASAVGGLLGTIDDGRTGWLVPSGDERVLADCLLEVLSDEPRREAMGAAARGAVEQRFAWAAAVEATIDVYREVLGAAL
jgi:glycosyltransferase involved in cell wall biosynthesis